MKKTFIMALACSLFAAGANAQTEEKYYGGEQGTFAFSINAEPVLNFAGNLLNGATYNSLDVNNLGKSIAAKFFVSDNLALKAGFSFENTRTKHFGYFSISDPSTYRQYDQNNYGNTDMEDYQDYIDELKEQESEGEAPISYEEVEAEKDFSFSVGAQYYIRPGKRLQPSVGADLFIGRTNDIDSYKSLLDDGETGKSITPTTTFGLIGNLGVEFFVTEKMSLGANLYFGFLSSSSKESQEWEMDDKVWEDHNPNGDFDDYMIIRNQSRKGDKTNTFATGGDLAEKMGGTVSLNFYF